MMDDAAASEKPDGEGESFLDMVARAAAKEEAKIKAGLSFVPNGASTKAQPATLDTEMTDVSTADTTSPQTYTQTTTAVDLANGKAANMSDANLSAFTTNSQSHETTYKSRTAPPPNLQVTNSKPKNVNMPEASDKETTIPVRSDSSGQRLSTATTPTVSSGSQPKEGLQTVPTRVNPYADERRKAPGAGKKIPMSLLPEKRKASSEVTDANEPEVPGLDETFDAPDWYLPQSQLPKTYDQEQHDAFLELRRIIKKCEQSPRKQNFYHDHMRRHLHKLEYTSPRADEVQRSKLLEAAEGLPRLFAKRQPKTGEYDGYYPWDIRGDAKMLYKKWMRQDFNSDLLRGIKVERKKGKEGKYRWTTSLDKDFPNKMRSNYFGEGSRVDGVVNGQWYPNQLCAVRDGAHGSAQAGIYGAGEGAYSIIVSTGNHTGGTYEDIDQGDTLYYVGTEAKIGDTEPTEGTKNLRRSLITKKPVRVLRTARMRDKTYAPSRGVRYDGLYTVVGEDLMDAEKHHYRFHLVRKVFDSNDTEIPQDPIRYQGIEKRPSELDIERFDKVQALRQGSEEAE